MYPHLSTVLLMKKVYYKIMYPGRYLPYVYCLQFSGLFFIFTYIFFLTLILFINVLFSVVLLKINLPTLPQRRKINSKHKRIRNLLASIVLPLGENCGVVYDKFTHFIFMACSSACVVVNTAICVK